ISFARTDRREMVMTVESDAAATKREKTRANIKYQHFLDILFIACSICNAESAGAEFDPSYAAAIRPLRSRTPEPPFPESTAFVSRRFAMSQDRLHFAARAAVAVLAFALCGLASAKTKWDIPNAYPPSY